MLRLHSPAQAKQNITTTHQQLDIVAKALQLEEYPQGGSNLISLKFASDWIYKYFAHCVTNIPHYLGPPFLL